MLKMKNPHQDNSKTIKSRSVETPTWTVLVAEWSWVNIYLMLCIRKYKTQRGVLDSKNKERNIFWHSEHEFCTKLWRLNDKKMRLALAITERRIRSTWKENHSMAHLRIVIATKYTQHFCTMMLRFTAVNWFYPFCVNNLQECDQY